MIGRGAVLAGMLLLAAASPEPFTNAIDAAGVIDRDVVAPDGTVLGHIVDVLVDPSGQPRAAVLDIGGFMGVGSRRVAIGWSDLRFRPGKAGEAEPPIGTELTPAQMRDTPEYKGGSTARVVQPANPLQGATPAR